MSYKMVGENRVSMSHSSRTSGLEAVHPVTRLYVHSDVFQGEPIFSLLFAYSPTPKAITDSLRPPNSD
jgi:hypothetical protein